jgi:hypothetical protein
MIYLFHGSDTNKVRAKAFAWVEAARKKAPEAFYTRLDAGLIRKESLQEAVSAQGLFFSKMLVLIDDPFSDSSSGDLVLAHIKDFEKSENIIAILAPKLLATRLKKIEGHAEKVFCVESTETKPLRGFNSALVNALGTRNGEILWKELIKAQRQGDAPEMIHGLLHWKARDLMSKGSDVWKPGESRRLSRDLIELLSDSRGRDLELGLALERFALKI